MQFFRRFFGRFISQSFILTCKMVVTPRTLCREYDKLLYKLPSHPDSLVSAQQRSPRLPSINHINITRSFPHFKCFLSSRADLYYLLRFLLLPFQYLSMPSFICRWIVPKFDLNLYVTFAHSIIGWKPILHFHSLKWKKYDQLLMDLRIPVHSCSRFGS